MERGQGRGGDERKTLQLCAQVRRTLSHYLNLELDDEVLQSLWIEEVRPAPDATRLQVTVAVPTQMEVDKAHLLARLEALKPTLRNEIARTIHRRKTPDLSFLLLREPD